MSRKPTPAPIGTPESAALAAVTLAPLDAQREVMSEQETRSYELAHSLGYEGALTVGGLEDEIRFYQRQTVESMLQVGKRLLMLKEVSPHGEFEQRVELLGFGLRSAQNFMAAAAKVSKSATVALLADRVKNQKAFLELITHDDGVIGSIAELDEFDKMSASQLRAKARDLKGELDAAEAQSAEKSSKLDKLKRRIAKATPDEKLLELQQESTALMNDALGCLRGQIRQGFVQLTDHVNVNESGDQTLFMAGLLGQIQAEVTALREEFNLPDVSNAAEAERAAEVAKWNKK